MQLADLLSECYAAKFEILGAKADGDARQVFAVQLHATGCSLREIQAVLGLLGVKRSHQAIWN